MQTDIGIALASTVNDVLQRHPETVTVFNAFGIDACCGGAYRLDEAASRDGADAAALLAALLATITPRPGTRQPAVG